MGVVFSFGPMSGKGNTDLLQPWTNKAQDNIKIPRISTKRIPR